MTCHVGLALIAAALPPPEIAGRPMGELDVARIGELHRLTDALGDELWPGFDARRIPVAVNHQDRQEMLIGHPSPPKNFHAFGDYKLGSRPVMILEGVTRYGPRGGGWAVDLGGQYTAYVSTLGKGQTTESYLCLLLHECFHVFQKFYRLADDGPQKDPPEDDPVYSAMIGLESRILHAILKEEDDAAARALGGMFVAVRRERRRGLPAAVIRAESEKEYSEGTATYVQARMYLLLDRMGGLKPEGKSQDPHYKHFSKAAEGYREYVRRVLPPQDTVITFFHSQYNHGMAQGLILDRLRPGWKKEMNEQDMTQFKLFLREFPDAAKDGKELVAAAKKRFGYEDILMRQRRHLEKRLATIRGFLQAKGRHYRIYHGDFPGRFNWKPKGPVYTVPPSLLSGVDQQVLIWAGGISRFERGDLVFESKEVPIIFRQDYLEWIDTDPAADGGDLVIRSKRKDDDLHEDVHITTDGFTLSVGQALIKVTDDLVTVHPLAVGSDP